MRNEAEALMRRVQDDICQGLRAFESQPFREDHWTRDEGGGGRTRVVQGGSFFEKAGVNFSRVEGELPQRVVESARGRGVAIGDGGPFFATGISLVLHPVNPHAPTVHANYRYFELEGEDGGTRWWFGGGSDLTPNYLVEDDVRHFHGVLEAACDRHAVASYRKFKDWCDRYFRIEHRDECRGVGGIFFDNLDADDPKDIYAFVDDCASSFLESITPIYARRGDQAFSEREKNWQALRRGRYVEFNLCYDRGTKFGLETKGRIESILMSLPLTARWEYAHEPEAGSEEARLVKVLREPRDWT